MNTLTFKSRTVTIHTTCCNVQKFLDVPQGAVACFIRFSHKMLIISLKSTVTLVLTRDTDCFLWGTNWHFMHKSWMLVFKRINMQLLPQTSWVCGWKRHTGNHNLQFIKITGSRPKINTVVIHATITNSAFVAETIEVLKLHVQL